MVELIDDFFAEYPVATGEPNTVDTDEVITPVAKTVAELTSSPDGAVRQNMIEQLKREIINFDAEFRQQEATVYLTPMRGTRLDSRHRAGRVSALNKYDFAYGSILTIFAAPRRRPEPYKGREWVRPLTF